VRLPLFDFNAYNLLVCTTTREEDTEKIAAAKKSEASESEETQDAVPKEEL
jgi:hypothetical protein